MSNKLAIFDLDGTVLDTLYDLTDSVNHVLSQRGYKTRTAEEIRSYLGNGAKKLIECALPEGTPDETVVSVLKDYQLYYGSHSDIKTGPYPGIVEMLTDLKQLGIKTAILSNKPDSPTKALSTRYFNGLIDYAAGETAEIPRKPAPDGVFIILEKLGISVEDAVFIGDSEVDIATAKNAGMSCISVEWGFRDPDVLIASGADISAKTAKQLADCIIKHKTV